MNGRVALVTGADNPHGIGRACCRALAARGARVACTILPGSSATEAEPAAVALAADLADPQAPAGLIDAVQERLGRLSILVNNAAHAVPDSVATLDARSVDEHYAVNVRAPALLSCELARRHERGTPGRVVNLTSGQFLGPMRGELSYATSKGALEAFTIQLAAEVAALGITVNAVNPGPTDTGGIAADLGRDLLPRFPLGRLGQPEDAARLVAFLCSDDAGWITGQVIHSEGGFRRE